MGESVETRACVFELDPRGFVRATMRMGLELELVDAQEALAATARTANRLPTPVLVDSRGLKRETKEAREHFVSAAAQQVTSAVAILIGSPVSRLIANFFLRTQKHPMPTQLFTEEAAAIEWLLAQRR